MGLNSTKSLGLRHSLARSCTQEVEGPHAYQLGLYIGSGTLRRLGDAYYLVLDLHDSALRRGEDGFRNSAPGCPFIVRHLATLSASCWSAVQSSGAKQWFQVDG
jgi:hypothetical protein